MIFEVLPCGSSNWRLSSLLTGIGGLVVCGGGRASGIACFPDEVPGEDFPDSFLWRKWTNILILSGGLCVYLNTRIKDNSGADHYARSGMIKRCDIRGLNQHGCH